MHLWDPQRSMLSDYHQGLFLAFPCIDPQVQVRVIHPCSDPPETIRKEDSSVNFWGWGTGQGVFLNVERRQRSSPHSWTVLSFL